MRLLRGPSFVSLLSCTVLLMACGNLAPGASTPSTASSSVPATGGTADAAVAGSAAGDWLRFDYDAQRSGVGPAHTGITAGNVGLLRLRKVEINGTVDSSAIELHAIRVAGRARDVIVVTTTYGRTIALDAGTGARLWEYVPRDIKTYEGSSQVTTATPIADADRSYVYAASPDGIIHKLSLTTGRQLWATKITFDATHEKIASALNISGKWVVAVTGGYFGDAPPYQGHVALIDRATGRLLHVWNSLCSNRHHLIDPPSSCPASDSAIWARAGAVIEPRTGRILVATGNAKFNGSTDWGDSALELTPDASRLLHNWTPTDQVQLNANDLDLGSSAPALLPETDGFRLAVQGGKDGQLHLLNLNRLDGTRGGLGRTGGELQGISSPGSAMVFTAPAVWAHAGRVYVFVADGLGTGAYVLVGGRHPHLHAAWEKNVAGTSPVIAGGLLYVYDEFGGVSIRQPTTGSLLRSLATGDGHWNSPIVVGGRVIVPEGAYGAHDTSGVLDIYHLPGR